MPIVDGHAETQRVGASAEGTRKLRAQAQVVETGWDMWRQKSDKSYRGVSARRAGSGVQDQGESMTERSQLSLQQQTGSDLEKLRP